MNLALEALLESESNNWQGFIHFTFKMCLLYSLASRIFGLTCFFFFVRNLLSIKNVRCIDTVRLCIQQSFAAKAILSSRILRHLFVYALHRIEWKSAQHVSPLNAIVQTTCVHAIFCYKILND